MPNPTETNAKKVLTVFLQSSTLERFHAALSAETAETWAQISGLKEAPVDSDNQGGQYLQTAWHLNQALAQAQPLTDPPELPELVEKMNKDFQNVLGILACAMVRADLPVNPEIRTAIIGFDLRITRETVSTKTKEYVRLNCMGDPDDHGDIADGIR